MQVGRVAAAVAVIAAVVSGCGGPAQAGSAVIVGNDVVPLEAVQSQLNTALGRTDQIQQLNQQGVTTADLARRIVTREVIHDLLTRRAAADGIVVTDAQVDAYLDSNGGADAVLADSVYDLPTLRERVRDNLIAAELGRQLAPGLAVTIDIVAATSREEAEQTARTLQAGGPDADALFRDPSVSARNELYQAVSSPNEAATVVFGVPEGTVGYFQPNPGQSQWIVFRVNDRSTTTPSDPAAVSSISQSQLAAIGERALQPDGEALGIRVNPRYGEWDPIQALVVAEGQVAGGILVPAAASAG
ncbi:hypothetical protein BJF78_28075 [Pseudonocardia sp. CNS-139]|nr:hypothetical protein BJF78_28075 [Pseudonocardia sp. CNS-139]